VTELRRRINALNILILGNLGPNEDRILALSTLGHKLIYAYVDFDNGIIQLEPEVSCVAIARGNMSKQIEYLVAKHETNVIYCVLNSYDGSAEAALELLDADVNVPIVRHYKEHLCVHLESERRALLETDGQIYINEQSLDYFRAVYGVPSWSAHIMDADMIAERYMTDQFSPKLRTQDGEPHLVVVGSASVLNDRYDMREFCIEMNRRHVHVHLYCSHAGKNQQGSLIKPHTPTARAYGRLVNALPNVHQHNCIPANRFTKEWSRYDAGVMHAQVRPTDIMACFQRMNYAHRYSAYLAAGLPLIVQRGGQDAMETLIEEHSIGIVFRDYDDLAKQLFDDQRIASLTENVSRKRKGFSFDSQASHLIDILSRYARR